MLLSTGFITILSSFFPEGKKVRMMVGILGLGPLGKKVRGIALFRRLTVTCSVFA